MDLLVLIAKAADVCLKPWSHAVVLIDPQLLSNSTTFMCGLKVGMAMASAIPIGILSWRFIGVVMKSI